MAEPLYINEGDMLIPTPFGIQPALIPLTVNSCNGQTLTCESRDFWMDVWRVVDARPGNMFWPVKGPKGACKNVSESFGKFSPRERVG